MKSENFSDRSFRDFPVKKKLCDPNDVPFVGSLPETLRVFRKATGCELRFFRAGSAENAVAQNDDPLAETSKSVERIERIPVGDPTVKIFGALALRETPDATPLVPWSAAVAWAETLATTLGENYRWRTELAEREAELGVAATSNAEAVDSSARLSTRLRDVLKTGAKALGGFDAAALYLLDDETTRLKIRALWGLPTDRFLDPPRPLRGARADVEALLGSAVVLNEAYLAEAWKAPEDFECSLCVPVASETTILGTIWFFSNQKREIETRELETLELIAGRVVAELEKESLRRENDDLATERRVWEKNVEEASRKEN
ncbi:MAG: GAF domain-containing protein [Thermoguttaceae bacterium]|nr:GAF domain-containing protein [Thermoguttaceae bacterium]